MINGNRFRNPRLIICGCKKYIEYQKFKFMKKTNVYLLINGTVHKRLNRREFKTFVDSLENSNIKYKIKIEMTEFYQYNKIIML